MTQKTKEMAPIIWKAIQKSDNILIGFHPSPDPDTVGSGLAMMLVLKTLGRKVTLIKGDSELPSWVKKLPGGEEVLEKNFFEIKNEDFDLFIAMDMAATNQVSKLGEVTFPENMTVVVIDHHISNPEYGKINLVDAEYVATCHMVYDLMREWGVEITPEVAGCLLLGMYTDSGGFKYPPTTSETLLAAANLAKIYPDYTKLIFEFENNNDKERVFFEGLALSNVENFFSGKVAIAAVSLKQMQEKGIKIKSTDNNDISNILKSVVGWEIGISFIQKDETGVSCSFRTRDPGKYDLSKIATALGGGGHKGAAGSPINKPFSEAKKLLLEKLAEVYPGLGKP